MTFFALLSGLINLSSQVVYQKIVSMVAGDLYTTFIAVTLTFILGAALGNYLGSYFRKYLAFIELGTGLYNLLIAFLLQGTFYDMDIPLWIVLTGLFLPAIALGTHIPLYSYYFRQFKFAWIFALYHLGGALGLLAIESYFTTAGSVSASILTLGIIQAVLGLTIIWLQRRQQFSIESSPARISLRDCQNKSVLWPALCVLIACIVSFYAVSWALKTQLMLMGPFRLHATCISFAVFVWMAVAGLAKSKASFKSTYLFIGMAFSFVLIKVLFSALVLSVYDAISGSLTQYFILSSLLALFLTVPVLFSSLIFIQMTSKLNRLWSVDVASGFLNLIAGLGNLIGFLVAAALASWFWFPSYFAVAVILCGLSAFVFTAKINWKLNPIVFIALAVVLFSSPFADSLFSHRLPKVARECSYHSEVQIFSHPQTAMALIKESLKPIPECPTGSDAMYYVVDGHVSHNLMMGQEVFVGSAAAMYFDHPLKKSLVVGVGSGQSAFGTSTVSEKTDLVEISPIVIQNLHVLDQYNHGILKRNNVNFILRDGFNFVRDCDPGSYDLILNTSTYASSFNASKLYSDEFLSLVAQCLSPAGVYHTYFDQSSVRNAEQLQEFLAPIFKHFKYVDIFSLPYPQVFARNNLSEPQALSKKNFLSVADENKIMPSATDAQTSFDENNQPLCIQYYANVRPLSEKAASLSTLDRSFIERNTLSNILQKSNESFWVDIDTIIDQAFPLKKKCLTRP